MHQRWLAVVLVAGMILPNTGCCYVLRGVKCWLHRWHEAKAARTYCCDSCGEEYEGEWFGDRPACCEPCDNCGHYVGPCRNRWVGPKRGCPTCNDGMQSMD